MKVVLSFPKPKANTWTVKGKTIVDLFDNLNKHKWWGRYRSHPEHSLKEKDALVSEFKLTAKPEVIMPKWAEYAKASKDEKKSWDDMWAALNTHENNHHTIFSDECDAWVKAMDKLGDLDKKKAKAEWDKFVKATQAKQDGYDKKTDHGAKEGVILNQV